MISPGPFDIPLPPLRSVPDPRIRESNALDPCTFDPDIATAMNALNWGCSFNSLTANEQDIVRSVAEAVMDERRNVHAQYEEVAARCDREAASRRPFAEVDPEYRNTIIPYEAAAEWIRAVNQ